MRKHLATLVCTVALVATPLASCAEAKPVIRTALDIARKACDVFLGAQPAPDGMTLDECADTLLSAQKAAAARQ